MAWDHLQKASKKEVVAGVMGKETPGEEKSEQSALSDLQSLEIEPADNGGFTVIHRLKDRKIKGEKGQIETHYQQPKKHVFADHASMMEHLGKVLKK